MALRHILYSALDRPGGRKILSLLATWWARRETSQDISIFYDGVWIHRIDTNYIAESKAFTYRHGHQFEQDYKALFQTCNDFWFYVYHPCLGDVIVDVGAGKGLETLVFSQAVGQQGNVLAIEAHPTTYHLLEKQCTWNRLQNVVPLQYAIMDKKGVVSIEDQINHESNKISFRKEPTDLCTGINGISLDELCSEQNITHIDFLKMNIEGAERLAICGMTNIIKKTRFICIACHDFLSDDDPELRTKSLVIDFLRDNNFRIVTRDDDPRIYVRHHIHGINEGQ